MAGHQSRSQKASLSTSMGLPSPSSIGTRHSPNGGKRENCAFFSQSAQGKWSDEACSSSPRGTYVSSPSSLVLLRYLPRKTTVMIYRLMVLKNGSKLSWEAMSLGIRRQPSLLPHFIVIFALPQGLGDQENNHSIMYTLLK